MDYWGPKGMLPPPLSLSTSKIIGGATPPPPPSAPSSYAYETQDVKLRSFLKVIVNIWQTRTNLQFIYSFMQWFSSYYYSSSIILQ